MTLPSSEGLTPRHAEVLEPEVIASEWLSVTSLHFLIQLFVMPRPRVYALQAMCFILYYGFCSLIPSLSPLEAIIPFASVLGCVPQKLTTGRPLSTSGLFGR